MLIRIPSVLPPQQAAALRARLDAAGEAWVDGRVTAGYQGMRVKQNQQLSERSALAQELGQEIVASLERNPLFISAALPRRVYPPMFNRYGEGMHFGSHIDNAVRLMPDGSGRIRTDLSATLFLSAPEEYDGGELVIEDNYGVQSVKLGMGDMVLYPATSLHQVRPITRGLRVASFFWIESMVRDDGQRTLLFDLDAAIQRLNTRVADDPALVQLTGIYHNLIRRWADS